MQIVISSEGFLYCVGFATWHVAVNGDHQCGTPRRDHHAAAVGRGHHVAAESAIAAAMPGGANARRWEQGRLSTQSPAPQRCPMLEKGATSTQTDTQTDKRQKG